MTRFMVIAAMITFNSLFEIHKAKMWYEEAFPRVFSFNSLFEILWGVFNRALTAIMGWARDEGEFGGKGVVRWVTAEDERVCPMCSSLEGKTWSLDELETAAFMQPPLHPNCRCRLEVE